MHLIKGHHTNHKKVSRSLKIAAELISRLQEGCFEDTRFFGKILEQDYETSPIEGSDPIPTIRRYHVLLRLQQN
jgi:hypothetical protein